MLYLYRRGNGNEGNYPRFIVKLGEKDDPYAALAALVVNDYIARGRVRKHIAENIEIDGEPEHGLLATVLAGPDAEMEFEHAWLTAELEPVTGEQENALSSYPLRALLELGRVAPVPRGSAAPEPARCGHARGERDDPGRVTMRATPLSDWSRDSLCDRHRLIERALRVATHIDDRDALYARRAAIESELEWRAEQCARSA